MLQSMGSQSPWGDKASDLTELNAERQRIASVYVCAQLLSRVRLLATPWTVAHQASLSVEFSRQEYWSGLPFSTPGDLPNSGIELASPALASRLFITVLPWEVQGTTLLDM